MPHLLAALDKFRGTASAADLGRAVVEAAEAAGWSATAIAMSDGGEGLLEVVGGEARFTEVPGPLGHSVRAEWRLLPKQPGQPLTAVVEMSRAAGRALLPTPTGSDPVDASTAGVGHLLLAARDAGAGRIVIGCGGSATTDGGWGTVETVGSAAALDGVELVVACDVTTPFGQAATVFGPQKGASPEQVEELTTRLELLATRYRQHWGIRVDALPGAGAAGGLAGGLAVLGARIVPGFDLVADLVGLDQALTRANLVITGEGHLDPPSFQGKVPGGVLERVAGRCAVVCIVGAADPEVLAAPPAGLEIISLSERFGPDRARRETVQLVAQLTAEALGRFCP